MSFGFFQIRTVFDGPQEQFECAFRVGRIEIPDQIARVLSDGREIRGETKLSILETFRNGQAIALAERKKKQ